ncbi:MAG: hypothetical protein IPM66_22285 [Acidobacteriota bacterium]|nr:MAG: hypothetical protein IPM66_22285 [Acidobacteriota bacterium]
MQKYLIVGDVDQIQSYVFASSRLRAIRGASALLENTIKNFKEAKEEADPNARFLRWRGGQVVIEFCAGGPDEAQSLCDELEEVLNRQSHGTAHITTTFVDYDDTKFRECLKETFRRIHDEKDAHHSFAMASSALLTSPYNHRCNYLPAQSASDYTSYEEDEEGRYVSLAADVRLAAVMRKGKAEFDQELLQKMNPDSDEYYLPYKLDDLFRNREGGYMGFIAADGNSIGQMLEVIPCAKLYKEFSEEIYDLTLEAIAQAAKRVGITSSKKIIHGTVKGEKRRYLPLIPVIVAGDDMSIIVQADDALRFAQELCENFASLSNGDAIQQVIKLFCIDPDHQVAAIQLYPDCFDIHGQPKPDNDEVWGKQRLTLSIGVAIAKRKFPISVYRRLAGELRDEAKKSLRGHPEYVRQGGVIDFAIITTPTAQSLNDLRDHYSPAEKVKLTMRPYSLNGFQALRSLGKKLKEMPRNKRKYLYTELFTSPHTGQAAFQFVMSKEENRTNREISRGLKEVCDSKGAKLKRGEAFCTRGGQRETPLIDGLEVAELSEMGG